jgi:hypothetical protein
MYSEDDRKGLLLGDNCVTNIHDDNDVRMLERWNIPTRVRGVLSITLTTCKATNFSAELVPL